MAGGPELGAPAPDFTLPGWADGAEQDFTPSAERGHPVVLAFYPGDETPVCTRQMCAYSDGLAELTGAGALVWGISPQDVASHRAFAAKRHLALPLLADTGKQVARRYGVSGLLMAKRSVFVIDADGLLRWKHVSALGLSFVGTETIAAQLARLPA